MAKEWDKNNMQAMAVNMKKEEAEAFKRLMAEKETTVAAELRGFIQKSLREANDPKATLEGVPHVVSYKNTDRLKHEVAHHNPNHLNPDKMLNYILERYFAFLDEARK